MSIRRSGNIVDLTFRTSLMISLRARMEVGAHAQPWALTGRDMSENWAGKTLNWASIAKPYKGRDSYGCQNKAWKKPNKNTVWNWWKPQEGISAELKETDSQTFQGTAKNNLIQSGTFP